MRRTRLLTAVLALAAGLLTGGPSALAADAPSPAPASVSQAADAYTWRNARIDGGGFVPGIVFSRSEPDLAYARTDIGGAYRWQESEAMLITPVWPQSSQPTESRSGIQLFVDSCQR